MGQTVEVTSQILIMTKIETTDLDDQTTNRKTETQPKPRHFSQKVKGQSKTLQSKSIVKALLAK